MKNKSVLRLVFFALFAFAVSSRAAIPSAEELLPSDTLFVLTVPDFAALKFSAKQSPQWQFWNDDAMKSFRENFYSKWNETFAVPLERDLGVKLSDFADLPQGQLTFAVTQNGWDGSDEHSPGFLLLLDAKTNSESLKTNLLALQKKWRDDGKPIRTEVVRGISFSVVTISSNDIPALLKLFPKRPPMQEFGVTPKPKKPSELVVGQFESLLIAGNSVEAVAPVVAHLTGSAMPSLNDNASFAAARLSQFHDAPLYFGWFNAKTFFSVLANVPPAVPNPMAPTVFPQPQWAKIFATAGLNGVNSASFTYHQNPDGGLFDFYVAAPEPSRSGLAKIFLTEAKNASPPSFVPANAIKFWRWRMDGAQSWKELQNLLDDTLPGGTASLNAALDAANAAAQRDNPGFDVRKYLFENLGDDFIGYTMPGNADSQNPPSIFLFAAHDSGRAAFAIQTVMSFAARTQGKVPEPRNFQGSKIYTIPLPAPQIRGANVPQRFLYCTFSGDYVAFATDVSLIENYLRSAGNPPKPLSGANGLIDAAQHVGGAGTGLFGYQNQRETFRPLFTKLKNQQPSSLLTSPLLKAPQPSVDNWMDFSLLPDFDRVSKYFYFSVFAGKTTTDGMEFKFFAPRPPDLK